MATFRVKYRCGECGEVYSEEADAFECCAPTVSEVFECPTCREQFDEEGDIGEHLATHDADAPPLVSHAELEAHGQQRLPI